MSNAQTKTEYSVSSDGVEVRKYVERDEFPVPAIAIEFTSDRAEPVRVRYVDPSPADVPAENVGFHPDHGGEHWEIESEGLVFEAELEPEAEYTTIYAIRSESTDLEAVIAEPHELEVEPVGAEGPADSRLDAEIPEVAGEHDAAAPAPPGEAGLDAVPDAEPPATEGSGAGSDGRERAVAEEADADRAGGNLVTRLTAEIEAGSVSEDELAALRDAIEPASGSLDARVTDLQSEVADLRAYTTALETFLDEHGTGRQLIAEFEERLDDVEGELESLAADVEANDADVSKLSQSVDAVETGLEDLEADLQRRGEAVEDLEAQLPEADLEAELDTLRDELAAVEEWRDRVEAVFGGASDDAD